MPFRLLDSTHSASQLALVEHLSSRRSTTDSLLLLPNSGDTIDETSYFDFDGIRISPESIIFRDVFDGETKRITFTLQNIAQVPALVKICAPNSYAFRLSSPLRTCLLAPGLQVTRSISFINLRHTYTRSMLEVFINDRFVEYPIHVHPASPRLYVEPTELDFGVVDVGSSAVVRIMKLSNEGAVGTKFSVDLGSNDLDLVATPLRGIIRAHGEVKISVELVGIYEGEFYREFWIKSASRPIRMPITVIVNLPHLIVYHPNTTGDFTLIDFEPAYFGTDRQESMVVRNISAQISTFVVLAEINKELHPLRDVAELIPEFSMFSIEPSEGRMEPFEGRIFTLKFHPVAIKSTPKTGWPHKFHEEMSKDFLVFVRILRVQCMDIAEIEKSLAHFMQMEETFMDVTASGLLSTYDNLVEVEREISNTISSMSHTEKPTGVVLTGPIVRLCLHGEAIVPSVQLQPNAIDFGAIHMGFMETRVLRLRNPSSLLTIHYRYKKAFSFDVLPPEGRLAPLEAVEVVVNATPIKIGVLETKLVFELLGQSVPSPEPQVVSRASLNVQFECPSATSKQTPQFNLGISPKGTVHEVGKSTDIVTFKTPGVAMPRSIMLQVRDDKRRPWAAVTPPPVADPPPKASFFSKSAASTRLVADTKCRTSTQAAVKDTLSARRTTRLVASTHTMHCDAAANYHGAASTRRSTPPAEGKELPRGRWEKVPLEHNYFRFVLDSERVRPKKTKLAQVATSNTRLCRKQMHGTNKQTEPLIAFPNERPRSNRPWPENQPCKTIFTGTDRYAQPVDTGYTYSDGERDEKSYHDQRYTDFTRTPARRRDAQRKRADLQRVDEDHPYDIGCDYTVYKLLRMKPPKLVRYSSRGQELTRYPAEVHVPLTPLQLYNVKVKPHAINFGKVAPNSNSSETLYLENLNNFAVKIRILPGRSGVLLPMGAERILNSHTRTSLVMIYNAESLGRYNGFMDYVINDSHSFEVTVTAEVVPKSLLLQFSELVFGTTSADEAFQPRFSSVGIINPLHSYTKFQWEIPENSSFTPKPLAGVVPPKRLMLCEMMKTPNPYGPQCSELTLRSESGIYQILKCCILPHKARVTFVDAKLDVGEIPLNLLTVKTTFMYNANYEGMMFKVVNPSPIAGCEVHPMGGVIKARSYQELALKMKIGAVVDFDFKIEVLVQRTSKLSLDVKGFVSYPNVVISPDILHLRRISADSFDIIRMCAENRGNTNVQISFNLEEYPEYHLSPSRKKSFPFFGADGFLLAPGKMQQFYLHFYPVDVATYHFLLPMVINNLLGPPDIDQSETQKPKTYMAVSEKLLQGFGRVRAAIPKTLPTVRIDCTVAGHILTFSKLEFYFKLVPGALLNNELQEDVRVSNEYRNPVTFCIRIDDLHEETSVFSLKYQHGKCIEEKAKAFIVTLEPGEFVVLRASFNPRCSGNYNVDAPIYVRNYGFGNVFNYLHFEGTYPPPEISAMKSEIYFLPVPLDVEAEKVIFLDCAYHPSNAEVSAVIAPGVDATGQDIGNVLKVKFLQGNHIRGMQVHVFLPVLITFKSSRPISFTTSVTFSDTLRGCETVAITATADCCSLTTHVYHSTRFTDQHAGNKSSSRNDMATAGDGKRFSRDDGHGSPQHIHSYLSTIKAESSVVFSAQQRRSTLQGVAAALASGPMLRGKGAGPAASAKGNQMSSYDVAILNELLNELEDDDDADLTDNHNIKMSDSMFTINPSINCQERVDPGNYYPKFPLNKEESDYARHMVRCLEAAETWLFEQGYRCAFAASIPDGLSAMLGGSLEKSGTAAKAKGKYRMKTILDLLVNLVGNAVHNSFPKQPAAESETQRVKMALARHKQLLTFLSYQGAYLAHVKPKYLFNYADYVTYKKSVRPQPSKNQVLEIPPNYEVLPQTVEGDFSEEMVLLDQLNEISGAPLISGANPPHHDVKHRYDPDCRHCLELLSEATFQRLSKQAWLDVILQIFKTLVLSQITLATVKDTFWNLPETTSCVSEVRPPANSQHVLTVLAGRYQQPAFLTGKESLSLNQQQRKLQQQIKDPAQRKVYSESEMILLNWLSTHFDKQRTLLWAPKSPEVKNIKSDSAHGFFDMKTAEEKPMPEDIRQYMPDERTVTNFDIDLADGLVLAAVTASHCPYLVPLYFTDLYVHPESPEQCYHNAGRLTDAWNSVRLGFSISPTDIVVPNSVLMLMLTASLYNLLPSLYPKTVVQFQTGLTAEVTRQIQLVNPSPRRIGYTPIFIGDPQGFFANEKPNNSNTTFIQPHEKTLMTLKYQARKIGVVKATLVLCGSTISPNFAQHLVFTLEGEPIQLQTSETFTLSAPLYRPTSIDLPIKPPYPGAAEYDILCTEVEPTNSEEFSAQQWRELRKRKVPRRLYLHRSRLLKQASDETALLGLTVACLAPTMRTFWLAFIHADVGDFIIRIVIIPRTGETMATLEAPLPVQWRDAECICTLVWATRELGYENCPCRSVIHMPCRSEELLYAVRTMFERTLEEKERDFWSHHLETNIGLRLIQWLLGDVVDSVSEEFSHIFCTSVTYRVECSAPNEVRVPEKLTIPDFRVMTTIAMPIHVSPTTPFPFHVNLMLTSENQKEIRNYRVHFSDNGSIFVQPDGVDGEVSQETSKQQAR